MSVSGMRTWRNDGVSGLNVLNWLLIRTSGAVLRLCAGAFAFAFVLLVLVASPSILNTLAVACIVRICITARPLINPLLVDLSIFFLFDSFSH